MGLFDKFKKKKSYEKEIASTPQELLGKAWLIILDGTTKEEGLKIMNQLHEQGFTEATVALAMHTNDTESRKELIEKAVEAGNVEATWQYCGFLPHSYIPDPNNPDDRKWEEHCLKAAEGGSADAMNEMGNIYNRRNNYHESMYWYAMATAYGHPSGQISKQGIAGKWLSAGKPFVFKSGSPKFDESRFKCAQAYLELSSGQKFSANIKELNNMVFNGVPIAGYLTSDILEHTGNYEMAKNVYGILANYSDPLGLKCFADRIIKSNAEVAFTSYTKAAELGERSAMFILGEAYKESNILLSAYWYGMAHTKGYEYALPRMIQLAQS